MGREIAKQKLWGGGQSSHSITYCGACRKGASQQYWINQPLSKLSKHVKVLSCYFFAFFLFAFSLRAKIQCDLCISKSLKTQLEDVCVDQIKTKVSMIKRPTLQSASKKADEVFECKH